MPRFHHYVAVLPLPFRRSAVVIPLFCKNYVRKLRSVTAVNSKKIRNGNGVRKRQRLTGTAKRNGNGRTATEWWKPGITVSLGTRM